MAMKCNKCGGIIPDLVVNGNRHNCDNHTKPELDIDMDKWYGRKQLNCIKSEDSE